LIPLIIFINRTLSYCHADALLPRESFPVAKSGVLPSLRIFYYTIKEAPLKSHYSMQSKKNSRSPDDSGERESYVYTDPGSVQFQALHDGDDISSAGKL
jgi:hypothetical protein